LLGSLSNLSWLYLSNNEITDISPLTSLTGLMWLYLEGNQIEDSSPFNSLTGLTELVIERDPLTDISPLLALPNADIRWVINLPDAILEEQIRQYIYKPKGPLYIRDMAVLSTMNLSGRNISDLSGMEYCTNMKNLELNNNDITDISPLASLTDITRLSLDNNQISDISALVHLTKIRYLSLVNNIITDIEPLVENNSFDRWDSIDLTGNPLDATSQDTHLPALLELGVEVSW